VQCFGIIQLYSTESRETSHKTMIKEGYWRSNRCNDPTIGSYNHYHLSPNGIPSGIQRWYGLVYIIHMAGNPRIRPRE